MSDNETEEQDEANKQNLIGVDPLAWLSDEEKESVLGEKQEVPDGDDSDIKDEGNDVYTINLNSALTIRDAADLLDELNAIDEKYNEIIFDCEQLERVDTAALQLLLGFYLFWTGAGKKISWNKPGDNLCNAIELLGLKDIIVIEALAA